MKMDEKKTVEVLWTGGYDSTYMVTRLSRRPVRIQPVYMETHRQSQPQELKAMEKIMALLKKHPATKAEFLPIKILPWGTVPEDPEVKAAYDKLNETHFLGYQYARFAAYAKDHPGMEIGIQDGHAISVIKAFAALKQLDTEEEGTYYVLDTEKSDAVMNTLFAYYHFPICETKKDEMKEWFHANGYDKVAASTWTCHLPIFGRPCGLCNPCKYAIDEGMTDRIGKVGMMRYHLIREPKEKNGTWKACEAKRYRWIGRADHYKKKLKKLFFREKKK